jgi:hypothetical protein
LNIKGKAMNKKIPSNEPNPWTDVPVEPGAEPAVEDTTTPARRAAELNRSQEPAETPDFDMEGLMSDFPTATSLERFVYDETGIVLNLKGRANKLKYQVAMDVLNGVNVDAKFLGSENPYVDKAEMVPHEELKPIPARDAALPEHDDIQNTFFSPFIPHPDAEMRAQDHKVGCVFRKYRNGMISYEVLGPLDTRPIGEKVDKFGRVRPEVIKWIDPRTGEQVMVREDGSLTPMGRNLRAIMQKFRVNESNAWSVWVDREFADMESATLSNPWDARV